VATNGHGPQPQTQHTWLTRGRLAVIGALIVIAGAVSAVVGLPFGSNGSSGGVPLDSVAALDPGTGQILATTPVGAGPQAVAVGAGSAWVGNTTDRNVSRLDAQTGQTTALIPIGVYPSDLAVGPGAVYVASGPLGQLVTIDTAKNDASNPQTVGQACGTVVQSIALGAGSLWLACAHTPSAVRIPLGGGQPVPDRVPGPRLGARVRPRRALARRQHAAPSRPARSGHEPTGASRGSPRRRSGRRHDRLRQRMGRELRGRHRDACLGRSRPDHLRRQGSARRLGG
jgi:hypothetical protein